MGRKTNRRGAGLPAKQQQEGKAKRSYSNWQITQALALYSLYGNFRQVSEELDIPAGTIQAWVKGNEMATPADVRIEDFSLRYDEARKRLIDSMSFVATEALQQVHRKLPDTSAAQAATIYGILYDKLQIALGNFQQVTNNNILIDMSGMSEGDKTLLLQRALARQTAGPAVSGSATTTGESLPDTSE
jgi:hypothetical protein